MIVRKRFPNYMTGFEESEHDVNTLEELKEIDWIKHWMEDKKFHGLYCSTKAFEDGWDNLMVLQSYDEKYGGCKSWWVIGNFVDGSSGLDLGLEEWDDFIGHHLDECPQGINQHNECNCGFRK